MDCTIERCKSNLTIWILFENTISKFNNSLPSQSGSVNTLVIASIELISIGIIPMMLIIISRLRLIRIRSRRNLVPILIIMIMRNIRVRISRNTRFSYY